jgi:hypothetical protein
MGINVIWQDENGVEKNRVNDPQNRLSLLVLATSLDEFICLRFLDPYGNTYFNQRQIPVLLFELKGVRSTITDSQFQSYYSDQTRQAKKAGWQDAVIKQLESRQGLSMAQPVRDHLDAVIELVKRSLDEVHTYIRFEGD